MTRARKATACVCVFSVLYMGCYTPALIDPSGQEKKKIYATDEVYYVITKDSTKYVFDYPPVITNDTIIGQVTKEIGTEVSIPLSDLAQVGESKSGNIQYVVTKAGTKYTFENTPAIINRAIVGETEPIASLPVKVAIPVSDVIEASISEFNAEKTWTTVAGVVLVVGVLVAMTVSAGESIGNGITLGDCFPK